MSTGLMSCVRENSPTMEMAGNETGGATSLPSIQVTESHKRRRFHPLRNLRRMFRRRTVVSSSESSSLARISTIGSLESGVQQQEEPLPTFNSPTSHQLHINNNLLETTNPTESTMPKPIVTASVPALLFHRQQQLQQQSTTNTKSCSRLPPSTTTDNILGTNKKVLLTTNNNNHNTGSSGGGGGGGSSVVLNTGGSRSLSPNALQMIPQFSVTKSSLSPSSSVSSSSGGYYNKKLKKYLTSDNNKIVIQTTGDEEELMQVAITSITSDSILDETMIVDSGRELTDSQRSLAEGRLVDSEMNRLSQSHDSVFSELSSGNSFSIGLKNELFDVLRKRRNRPDQSADEDAEQSASVQQTQRNKEKGIGNGTTSTINTTTNSQQMKNQTNPSDLSLLSVASSDLDEDVTSSYFYILNSDRTGSSINSSSLDTSKTSDEIDLSVSSSSRLSHSAARHRIAVRPKKKLPRRHNKQIDSDVLPSMPELNEDFLKNIAADKDLIASAKSHSLPAGVNAKILDQHNGAKEPSVSINSKPANHEKESSPAKPYVIRKNNEKHSHISVVSTSSSDIKEDEGGFFKRLLHRNSKNKVPNKSRGRDESDNAPESVKGCSSVSESCSILSSGTEKPEEYSQLVEETRQEIRREILSEAKFSLSGMLNTFIMSTAEPTKVDQVDAEQPDPTHSVFKLNKPKSGPAARQRVMPKDLSNTPQFPYDLSNSESKISSDIVPQSRPQSSRHSESSDCSVGSGGAAGLSAPRSILIKSNEFINCSAPSPSPLLTKAEIVKFSMKPKSSIDNLSKSSSEETFQSASVIRDFVRYSEKEHFEKHEHRAVPPKIVGLSPFQMKISKSEAAALDVACPPVPKLRKSVEKSKSFRYYSEGQDVEIDSKLKKYDNMPSLPDLSFARKSFENIDSNEEETSTSLGFEINDNNLITLRSNEEPFPLSQGIFTKNIIITTSKPKQNINKNITEIEDNIDKLLVKSTPIVSVMKKSSSMITNSDQIESKHNLNISITPIKKTEAFIERPWDQTPDNHINYDTFKSMSSIDPVSPAVSPVVSPVRKSESKSIYRERDPNGNSIMLGMTKSLETMENRKTMPMEISKSVDSICMKVNIRKKDTTGKLDSPTKARRSSSISSDQSDSSVGVPEFMKIQLNRVIDPGRGKSNIVLSKNVKESSGSANVDETRRSSNESVEITDKPPLPPQPLDLKRNSNCIPITKDDQVKSPTKKISPESNQLQQNNPNLERRKSVTDEKLKYEKKIEELKSEFRKSNSHADEIRQPVPPSSPTSDTPKTPVDEEFTNTNTSVVMRKKSFASPTANQSTSIGITLNNCVKDDSTPELMKVFARRSLKIKDDELHPFDELSIDRNSTIPTMKFSTLDSDKENQSSSEEKLDKLPKIELTIQQKPIAMQQQKTPDEKTRNSLADLCKTNTITNSINMTINNNNHQHNHHHHHHHHNVVNNNNNNNLSTTATKTFSRYSTNIVNYNRNSTAPPIFNTGNKIPNTQSITIVDHSPTTATINENKIITTEQNNNLTSNNSLSKKSIRHTIGPAIPSNLVETASRDGNEFKGILQRRAEWEKRAKEAFK